MIRIAGVNLPSSKRIDIALTYIHGIGLYTARLICHFAGIPQEKKVFQLNEEDGNLIRRAIDKINDERTENGEEPILLEGDLRSKVRSHIDALISIKCYKGRRHINKLPVRGQRTKTNARTRKGKAIAIAGKKKATK